MRLFMILAGLAAATAAVAQDKDRGWTWEAPGATSKTEPESTAPNSVLDRLQHSKPSAANEDRRQKWLEKFESRGSGGSGGEGGGGDAGGPGGHG